MARHELEVLEANSAFYAAFAARDLAAMEALWARRSPVACVHPGWAALRGRDEVMESWRAIFGGDSPAISCTRASAHVVGETAFVVCHEQLLGGTLVATNLFVREDGGWRLCLHQASQMVQRIPDEPPGGAAA